jgi:cytochrome c peroxidase
MMDGGITNLEVMPFAPITSAHEMNADMATVVSAVQQRADYRAAFNRAFDEDTVTSQRIFYALAIFQSGMISANSRWDQRERGELVFSDVELWGEGLFVENCASCHPAPFFTDWTYVNVGLDSITDPGRYLVSQDSADYSAFKVPSLRNVVLSPPYFHDGRAATLEQAVNHFTAFEGGGGMDQRLLDMRELDKDEKLALLSFLHTLTDYSYTTNPLFEKP